MRGSIRFCFTPHAGDLALLVDTNHPMVHPEFERGLEWAKKALQANGSFCLQVSTLTLVVQHSPSSTVYSHWPRLARNEMTILRSVPRYLLCPVTGRLSRRQKQFAVEAWMSCRTHDFPPISKTPKMSSVLHYFLLIFGFVCLSVCRSHSRILYTKCVRRNVVLLVLGRNTL